MGWSVRIGERVTRMLVDMDDQTQTAFLMAMVDLRRDPERWPVVGPKDEAERTIPLGDLGVIGFKLYPDEFAVEIVNVTWIG
jgi:hypothetical protein